MLYLKFLQSIKILPGETGTGQIDDEDVQVNVLLGMTKRGVYLSKNVKTDNIKTVF